MCFILLCVKITKVYTKSYCDIFTVDGSDAFCHMVRLKPHFQTNILIKTHSAWVVNFNNGNDNWNNQSNTNYALCVRG
ncbi:MAG: hypothetical protein U9N49_07845, partial [Campylobacterota bacterium]|nr:hypothetical protein [Campylobacterota bacterium]